MADSLEGSSISALLYDDRNRLVDAKVVRASHDADSRSNTTARDVFYIADIRGGL